MADDGYVRSVAKAIVTHLASSQKFDGIQRSSIDVLADLLLRFIGEVGRQSHAFAEISHRKDINPIDVVCVLPKLTLIRRQASQINAFMMSLVSLFSADVLGLLIYSILFCRPKPSY